MWPCPGAARHRVDPALADCRTQENETEFAHPMGIGMGIILGARAAPISPYLASFLSFPALASWIANAANTIATRQMDKAVRREHIMVLVPCNLKAPANAI